MQHAGHSGPAGKQDKHTDHQQQQGGHQAHHAAMIADYRRRFWFSLALTVPILALSPMIRSFLGLEDLLRFPGDALVLFLLATGVYFYGGWPFLRGLYDDLSRREPGMMTLIGLAITVAYGYSSAVVFGLEGEVFFWELATLIDVMLIGHWVEMRSVMGASGALEALVRLLPTEAHRLREDGSVEEVSASDLAVGDKILVKPGEKVPTDGVIAKGESSFDESMLTGESVPVYKDEGTQVIGGSVNGENSVTVEIRKTGRDTYLSQVIDMVQQAQSSRSRSQNLADRAGGWLTYIAISAGLLTLFTWLTFGADFEFSLERMVTVMVITCPHALGLAVPLVVAMSTSMGASNGLLIRNRAAFEQSRDLGAVVFDKTGTLTEGHFGVRETTAFGDWDETEVLRIAAALESQSEHPIARGVTDAATKKDLKLASVSHFHNLTGRGAEAEIEGRRVRVVSPGYAREEGFRVDEEVISRLSEGGNTVILLIVADEVAGAIALADVVRASSKAAVTRLKAMGIQCIMLTGDTEAVARSVAAELGLDDYFAGVLPDQKAAKIREVKQRGLRVAMVGDGVNDAPALVESDLGIAIGAGTDVAIESADVVLVKNDPEKVAAILALSRATYRKMLQNLGWATGYNVVAIPLAAGVAAGAGIILSPAIGAALMSVSTVIVAVNARLLKRTDILRSTA
ncbi:copper-translocating P-type ATPase [Thiohalomonas denitrificans]|uniref:Cu2+-exporting ATPase n=1 Tax=Thiohalomonas denitrificans TaxID=415747 RepID=A0A1G5QCE9_9GAMM|nr:Cu2+-exporting ATPase [Thiohalomonas denitrificans]